MVGLREVLAAGGRKHPEQLLERKERLPESELHIDCVDVLHVGCARGVVERVVPDGQESNANQTVARGRGTTNASV